MLNMITMSMEHYGQSQEFEDILGYINLVGILYKCYFIGKLIRNNIFFWKFPSTFL